MDTAVILLNFGEPEDATLESVVPFLERIFDLNRDLEAHATSDAARARTKQLAAARAPALVAEYQAIGGSPLHRQARDQAEGLQAALAARGVSVNVLLGMQFTEPSIEEAVRTAADAGAARIVGLPVYPLCGPTTTVAALATLADIIARAHSSAELREVSGWHRHPSYIRLRADMLRATAEEAGVSLSDPSTHVVFSAHGTPLKYLAEGSRYEEYVRDCCASVADAAGISTFHIGYQNHSNRPLEWTQPEVTAVLQSLPGGAVIVDPISFMHEQSETLAELDHELRESAEELGLAFHRVKIPHDTAAFIDVLADLVEPFVRGDARDTVHSALPFTLCRCRATDHTYCLNGAR